MCAFLYVRVATIATRAWLFRRAAYKGARFSSEFRLAHSMFIARNSASFRLCVSAALCLSSRLRLCLSSPSLCSALLSVLLSSLICYRLCSALLSAVVFSLSARHSTLLCIRLYSSFRLCICVCSRRGLTRCVAFHIHIPGRSRFFLRRMRTRSQPTVAKQSHRYSFFKVFFNIYIYSRFSQIIKPFNSDSFIFAKKTRVWFNREIYNFDKIYIN